MRIRVPSSKPRRLGLAAAAGLLPVAAAILLLAGCAGDTLGALGNATIEPAASEAARESGASAGDAFAGVGGQRKADTAPFNPFQIETAALGGRQVIANPSIAEVMQAGPLPEMALGAESAPVTVIKYASLTCPHCRRFHREVFPQLKRAYIDTGKVRFILREFPIGRSSGNATVALRCVPPSKYFTLYGLFLEQQGRWVSQEVRLDAIHSVASQAGLSRADFDACLANQGMIDGLRWVKDRGRTLGIIGTPNFFIQGKLVKKVLTFDELKAMIEAELAAART